MARTGRIAMTRGNDLLRPPEATKTPVDNAPAST
jgi:hypothetical protein